MHEPSIYADTDGVNEDPDNNGLKPDDLTLNIIDLVREKMRDKGNPFSHRYYKYLWDEKQSTLTVTTPGGYKWILQKDGEKWLTLNEISLSVKREILSELNKKSLYEQSHGNQPHKHNGRGR